MSQHTDDLVDEDECTVDLRLVRDPDAWRAFVRSKEAELRAMARTPADAETLIRRLLGKWF